MAVFTSVVMLYGYLQVVAVEEEDTIVTNSRAHHLMQL